MSKQNKIPQKNKVNKRFGIRLALICIEVFILVVIVGIGLLLLGDGKEGKELQGAQTAVVEEKIIEMPSRESNDLGEEKEAEEESLEEPGRYGKELADAEYCKENRIYAKSAAAEEEVVLTFAGDISFAEGYANVGALAQRNGDITNCFDMAVLKLMQDADVFMVNNEFPYTDRGTPTAEKTFTFRAKPENAKYLHDMGVDIVSIANNHVYDYGEVSLLDTLTTLEEMEIPYVGAGRNLKEAVKPVYFVINDIKIAYVAATQIEQGNNPDTVGAGENTPGTFRCWENDYVCEVIKEAGKNADFVVAYIHWGTESTDVLHWSQMDLAPKLVKAGADLVVGAHPHCLQEIAYIDGVPVIYSLGNFWFNSKTQDTGILKAVINDKGLQSLQFVPAIQSGCKTTSATDSDSERILEYLQSLSPTVTIDDKGYITEY